MKKKLGEDGRPRCLRAPRGNCYVTCEAIYHLTGGAFRWHVMRMRWEGDTHWFLRSRGVVGFVFDPTASQFQNYPDHSLARATGFLTKRPSQRAAELMRRLVWQ